MPESKCFLHTELLFTNFPALGTLSSQVVKPKLPRLLVLLLHDSELPRNEIDKALRRFVFHIKPHLHLHIFFSKRDHLSLEEKREIPFLAPFKQQMRVVISHTVSDLDNLSSSSLLLLLPLKMNLTAYDDFQE